MTDPNLVLTSGRLRLMFPHIANAGENLAKYIDKISQESFWDMSYCFLIINHNLLYDYTISINIILGKKFQTPIEVLLSSYFKRSLSAFLIFQIMFYGFTFRKSKDKGTHKKIFFFIVKLFFKAVLRSLIYKNKICNNLLSILRLKNKF